jgi:hypothetical protein
MGKKLIITEEEKKKILSLYEQNQDSFEKENNFLKRYIGKTLNLYSDVSQTDMGRISYKIETINYEGGGITINQDSVTDKEYIFIECNYNPSKIGYKMLLTHKYGSADLGGTLYNKKFVDDINNYGLQSGITWCKKPKADFSSNQKTTNQSNLS